MEKRDAISLSEKGDLIHKILELLRTSGSLILTCWSSTTASNNLLPYIWQARTFFTSREMMRTSRHSIESIRGDDVTSSFGLNYFILVQLLSCISRLWVIIITSVISQKYPSCKAYKRATRPLLWIIEWLKLFSNIQLNSRVYLLLSFECEARARSGNLKFYLVLNFKF